MAFELINRKISNGNLKLLQRKFVIWSSTKWLCAYYRIDRFPNVKPFVDAFKAKPNSSYIHFVL
jgi:hypothetical protein